MWILGPVSPIGEAERAHLNRAKLERPPSPGFSARMACFCEVLGDAVVALPAQGGASVLSSGEGVLPAYDGAEAEALGFAIDIGTTTVAMRLYDLPQGRLLCSRGEMNRQGSFGADVLSRIAYADKQGFGSLTRLIREQLSDMASAMLSEAGVSADAVRRVAVAGNTTMLHFAAGLDPHGIGISPFTPESLFGGVCSARAIVPCLPEAAEAHLARCISAYVGGDVTAGLHASGFYDPSGTRLLIDVGTNGEMALLAGGRLLCCATAAGPAFEGAQISMGMPAAEGAVHRVRVENGALLCETIGNAPARGLCGTGLISAVCALRRVDALSETGALESDPFPLGDSGVTVTGRDMREVQLAKAAIAAGIDALLEKAGVSPEAVDEVLLAGGFGSTIDPVEAAVIGLIPQAFIKKTRAVGNIALLGAAQFLFSRPAREAAEAIAAQAVEIPLATNPVFIEQYMERMMFPEETALLEV